VYSPNGTYSTTIYVIRSDGSYVYRAANHSLELWKSGDYLYIGQDTNAPIKFGLVWNKSIAPDEKAAMAEIGMIGQNVYFDANALGLASLTTGSSVSELYDLDLPSNEKAEIIMHLGHATTAYSFMYNPLPEENLPPVVNNTLTLAGAINARQIVNKWNNTELPLLEESQILWCSYGTSYLYDNLNHKRHRTPPSAIDIYPFKVYSANQSGVYLYDPGSHSVSQSIAGDQRELIQSALASGNISVATAPWIIIPIWDKNVGSQTYLTWWYYETGAIVHDVLLEAGALNLSCNVVTVVTDQDVLRSALGVSGHTNLVAMAAVMVGHPYSETPPPPPPNHPPAIPSITGPSSGKVGVIYNYFVQTYDIDGDEISYLVDWGDGTNSGWVGTYSSNTTVRFNHSWDAKETYVIKAKAKDVHDAESGWGTLQVTIPTFYSWNPLLKILEQFPFLVALIRFATKIFFELQ
jgi:nitroreductase